MIDGTIALGELMATKKQSLDPRKTPEREFALYSIPAYDEGQPAVTLGGDIGSSKQVLKSGDVLLSRIVPHIRRAWIVDADGPLPAVGSGEWIVFRGDGFHAPYLRHVLLSDPFHRQFMNTVAGVGGSLLRARPNYVAEIKVPLPPILEQRRIAQVLDATDDLRAKRRETLAQLDTLTQAIFTDMFGDPLANTRGWPRRSFAELCPTTLGKMLDKKQRTGLHLRPYLRNANVRWFGFDLTDLEEMDFDPKAQQKYRLEAGDVLICEGGEPGRAAVWRDETEECYFQKALHRGRPDSELATSDFIVHLLYHLAGTGGLLDHISTATIAHLTGKRLKEMQVIAPPLKAQEEFSRRMAAVEAQKRTLTSTELDLSALFASIQQRAFRGEL